MTAPLTKKDLHWQHIVAEETMRALGREKCSVVVWVSIETGVQHPLSEDAPSLPVRTESPRPEHFSESN